MRSLGAHVYRDRQGNFEPGFLKAAFVATLENTVPPLSIPAPPPAKRLPHYGVTGKYAQEDLAWVRSEYTNLFKSPEGPKTSDPPSLTAKRAAHRLAGYQGQPHKAPDLTWVQNAYPGFLILKNNRAFVI